MSKKYRYIEEDVNYHFLSFVKEIFESHFSKIEPDTTIENFCSNLSDDQKEKLFRTSFFYYHRGWKLMKQKNWSDNFDESFIFIILISIAEAIVSAEDYVEFISWYPKNHQEMRTFEEEKEIYLNKFGVKRKFHLFVDEYITEEDRNTLMKNINIWDDSIKSFKSLGSVSELSKFFYDLRSNFVHNAQYISIFVQSGWALCGHKNKAYSIKIDFPTIVPIFERGFLNYFIKNK